MTQGATLLRQVAALWRNLFQIVWSAGWRNALFRQPWKDK
jgi:hypothetical protein